jgi:Flp pilus assembly protein TadG
MQIRSQTQQRKAATIVEFSVICVLLFMLLFGILEFCRFLYVLHVANNAARDAVRFAVVHTNGGTMPGEPTTISQADLENMAKTGQIQGIDFGSGLGEAYRSIDNFAVSIFAVDPAGLNQTTPVVQSGGAWNSASFGQKIAVRITGDYKPAAIGLLFLNSTITFRVTLLASSEAN